MNIFSKITYNSPVILSFALLSTIIFIVDAIFGGLLMPFFSLSPYFDFTSLGWYFSLFTYTLGHASLGHLFGNISFMLLIGPILEEKYGSKSLIIMMLITAFLTALLNNIFFSTGIIGASGIVFMMIILVSFTNAKEGEIPLTFVLVMALYLGKEVFMAFDQDTTSQFAHILGGLAGAVFGFSPFLRKGMA